jgi:hypothetical protein
VAEVQVSLGTKLSEQEQQNIDMTKALRLTAQPPPGTDVEAQCSVNTYCAHICPYCGCVGWDNGQQPWLSSGIMICHCCGHMFRI